MVGDNIYHRDAGSNEWHQADSHHANPDGTANAHNLIKDTKSDHVLLSKHFFYFGRNAPVVPPDLLMAMGYKNPRDYRRFTEAKSAGLLDWLTQSFGRDLNRLLGDPFDFDSSHQRYSALDDRIR